LQIIANDIDDFSIAAIQLNASMNSIENIGTMNVDLCSPCLDVSSLFADPSKPLTILCGDVFYDIEFASIVMDWLAAQRGGAKILVGDPGRHALPRSGELVEVR